MRALVFVAAWLVAGVLLASDIGKQLQSTSVNIKAGYSQGSGTVVLRKMDGKQTAFVITAAHVIDSLRSVRKAISDEGETKSLISYRDAQIVQEVSTEDASRTVGDTRLDAKIITVDYSRDIALLRVRSVGTLKTSAKFYAGKDVPSVGTEVLHCGAPGGQDTGGSATLTAGIISRTGVRIPDFGGSDHGIFDQTDTAALGGSSGGMICLRENGEWVGMITLGLGGDSFHWFVPIRNVRDFCDEAGCKWLLDGGDTKSDSIEEIPIEVSPPTSGGSA
jgi:S1-C subfamily serine protease